MTMTMPHFRDIPSVAERLGLKEHQVRQAAKASGCHSRVGGRRQIMFTEQDEKDLTAWLESQWRVERVPTPPAEPGGRTERDLWGE